MIIKTLITDFSHVYEDMGFMDAMKDEGYSFEILDLSEIEGTSCYCSPEAEAKIGLSIAPFVDFPIRWIDSGDYHYMTKIFARSIRNPFTLLLLDNHPDDQEPEFGKVLSCGSWVSDLKKENPFLERVISIGPDGLRPSASGPYGDLYISLDKDIMSKEWARTDWSQGEFNLDEVLSLLEDAIDGAERILAIDICGELSASHGASPEDMRINLETNIRIQKFLTDKLTNR